MCDCKMACLHDGHMATMHEPLLHKLTSSQYRIILVQHKSLVLVQHKFLVLLYYQYPDIVSCLLVSFW